VYQQQTATEPAVTATLLSDTIRSDDSIRFQIENTGTANVSGNVKIQPPEMSLTLGSPTPSTVSLTPEEAATVAAPIRELPSDSPSQSVTVDLFIDELKVVSESIKLATQSPSSVETTDGNSGENTPASSSNPMHDTDTDTATDAVEKNVKGSQTQDSISSLRNNHCQSRLLTLKLSLLQRTPVHPSIHLMRIRMLHKWMQITQISVLVHRSLSQQKLSTPQQRMHRVER